jgi:hypothetical protein
LESQFVVFSLGTHEERSEYGVPIMQVQEVWRLVTPTRLPQVPEFVEGVIDLRGRIIPVIDLHKRFGSLTVFNGVNLAVAFRNKCANDLFRVMDIHLTTKGFQIELLVVHPRRTSKYNAPVKA